jgi:hypothetical protein
MKKENLRKNFPRFHQEFQAKANPNPNSEDACIKRINSTSAALIANKVYAQV